MLFVVICGATTTLKAQEAAGTLPDCRNEFRIGVGANLTDLFSSYEDRGEHWFGATELGGLFGSAAGTQIGSRIISIAVGYRF